MADNDRDEPAEIMAEQSHVSGSASGLPKFDVNSNVATEWPKWKRAFNLFLRSRKITDDDTKQALLLHEAGVDVQDVYYTLSKNTDKNYVDSVKLLDAHFMPKVNIPFERNQFRHMSQLSDETIAQYVCRLRKAVIACQYGESEDEAIRDQVMDSCRSASLRKKFLEQDGITLDDVLKLARAHEAVDRQVKAFQTSTSPSGKSSSDDGVNSVRGNRYDSSGAASVRTFGRRTVCYACGRHGHIASDVTCPARESACAACGQIGHFRAKCPKAYRERQQQHHRQSRGRGWRGPSQPDFRSDKLGRGGRGVGGARPKSHRRKVNQVADHDEFQDYDESQSESENDYVFSVTSGANVATTEIVVGGVILRNVLIDSGSNRNVVSRNTWEYLKSKRIKCKQRKENCCLYPYGSEPLLVVGTFITDVKCGTTDKVCRAEFSVIDKDARSILSKETSELLDILRVGPSPDVNCLDEFPQLCQGVGLLKGYSLKLHIDESVHPVAQPLRRIPFGLRGKVDKKLNELLDAGIIEPVPEGPSGWVSPLVVIPKGNDVRICVDMRRANTAIIRERHPIPTIDELLVDLNQATHFSKIDLKMGFHQIELTEECRHITTFVTHRGLYRYRRLMFGLSSAPEKYQQIIRDVLAECGEGTANIADDIIIYGRSLAEHDSRLRKVLERLSKVGLTVNAKKCQFRLTKLTFFGHNLTSEGVSPSDEKVQAIRQAPPPTCVSEVKSLLGLLQYCSRFIPSYSTLAEPIQQLCRKNVKFVWGSRQQESFEKLKQSMVKADTLAYFRTGSKTRVIADASPFALGAVLTQLQNNVWRVISYASRSLTEVERRYSQTEKESLALVWACERFSLYLYGLPFELETDHKPLETIFSTKSKPPARIERWVLRLQGFDMHVVYRPGKTNIADCLSRLNAESRDKHGDKVDIAELIAGSSLPCAIEMSELQDVCAQDDEISELRQHVLSGEWHKTSDNVTRYLPVKEELSVFENLVLRGTRIVVPRPLRKRVLELAHEGHQGIVKTKNRLRTKVWWPRLDKDAEKICKNCFSCQLVGPGPSPEPMARVVPPSGPWQDVALDLLGPLPSGETIAVLVDYYSRYYEVAILRSTTTAKILAFLSVTFARFGIPYSLRTDNGPQFIASEFRQYMKMNNIHHYRTTPLWPQANGEVERQNRTLLKFLRIVHSERKNWKNELSTFLMAYRSTPQISTGATPYLLMFGREMRSKLPDLRPDSNICTENIRDKDWNYKISQKLHADKQRQAKYDPVTVGDEVFIRTPKSHKLSPNYDPSPGTIVRRDGGAVTVQRHDGSTITRHTTDVKRVERDGDGNVGHDNEVEITNDAPKPSEVTKKNDNVSLTPRSRTQSKGSLRPVKLPVRFDDYVMN